MTTTPRMIAWMQTSLDGRTAGPHGEFDWPRVAGDLHQHFVDTLRDAGTFIYGHTTFGMMASYWPTADEDPASTPAQAEYARIWRPMPKLVVSRSLRTADWNATVLPDVTRDGVQAALAGIDGDAYIFGGAETVAAFARLDLIDEYQAFVHPVILGGGTPFIPELPQRQAMSLVDARVFDGTVTGLRYRRER